MTAKNSFVLYTDYINQIELLDIEQRGVLFTAIMYYSSGVELPEMDAVTAMAFSFIKSQLDKDLEKYNKTVESRKEAGKRGGRPSRKDNNEAENQEKANGFSEKQAKAKKANGFSEKQAKAKKPDNEYDNDNVNDNESDNDNDSDIIKYQQIADMYNGTCVSFPTLTKLSDRRRRAIKARFNAGYTLDDFQRLFKMAEESDFLKGCNGRNWSATFDWLIQDGNMAKVLDGNYQSREPTKKGDNHDTGGKDTGYDGYLQEFIESGGEIPEFTGF